MSQSLTPTELVQRGVAFEGAPASPVDYVEPTNRFGLDADTIRRTYLQHGEQLAGFANGGSEALVMFVTSPIHGQLVRKVCAEDFASVGWDPNGTGVMTPPSTKGGLQASYLLGLPSTVRSYFPGIHNAHMREEADGDGVVRRKFVFDQTVLRGVEVSTFVAEAQPSPTIVGHVHREIMRLLDERIHPHRKAAHTGDSIEPSHLDKIEARLELSRAAAPDTLSPLLDSETIIINGRTFDNIGRLLQFFRQPQVIAMLEPRSMSLVMGDTNTENVMITHPDTLLDAMRESGPPEFTYDDIGLKFLDPRAIGHESNGKDTRDDRMYDNKPVHNTIGNYDVVHGEYFSIAIGRNGTTPSVQLDAHPNNPYSGPYANMQRSGYFKYVMGGWAVGSPEFQEDDPNWLLRFTFMMGTHFASMSPFHFTKNEEGIVPEDADAQKRAIAIYCQGIRWLNNARDMITGQRRSLYGVSLDPLRTDNRA